MHKIMHNKSPEYLADVFNLIRGNNAYNLRDSSFNLTLQKPNSESLKKNVFHIVVPDYGTLPNTIKTEQSVE